MTSPTFEITQAADKVAFAHAACFYAAPTIGLLFARSKSSEAKVVVDTVIPLFHSTPLAPHIDTALHMAVTHAREEHLLLVGVYFAPEDSSSSYEHMLPILTSIMTALQANTAEEERSAPNLTLFIYIPENGLQSKEEDAQRYQALTLANDTTFATLTSLKQLVHTPVTSPKFAPIKRDFVSDPVVDWEVFVDSSFAAQWLV